jgi:hypothetical protein
MRLRFALPAAVAILWALPAAASADTPVTGQAAPAGDLASARLHLTVTPACTGSPDYGAEWQRVSGGDLRRIGVNAQSGQAFDGDVTATSLVAGAVYRYRAYGSTYCNTGTYQPTAYGEYRCFKAGPPQADGTLNVSCDTPEGTTGSAGTETGTGTGTAPTGTGTTPPGTNGSTPHVRASGRRCIQPRRYKFISVLDVKTKDVPCRTIYKLVYSDRNRGFIGKKARFRLKPSRFVCKAVARRTGNADYRCASGSKSWYMHTYASGPWALQNQVVVDY